MNSAEQLLANDPASQMLGIQLVSLSLDQCELTMPVTANMTNGYEVCHGGFIFSLADTACAFAAAVENKITLTASNHIDYLAPAKLFDQLVASAKISRRSGKSLFAEVEVCNQAQQLLAVMHAKLIQKDEKN